MSRTSGVQIDGYVMTGFKGFRAMINAMGGLRYVAPAVFKGEHGILAKKGLNILRGEPALSFARERHTLPNGDFGRSQNQGRLILAGMGMARAGGHKALVKYLGAMSPHVETDLSTEQVLNLGGLGLPRQPEDRAERRGPGCGRHALRPVRRGARKRRAVDLQRT